MAFATPKGAAGAAAPFDAGARQIFLDHLAMTAHVAASARAAGVSASTPYLYRRRHPAFAEAWQHALCEGFARLEATLLAEALTPVSGKISDAALKSRAQKHRLALALLGLHHATVKGSAAKPARPTADQRRQLADKVEAKLRDMRARLKAGHGDA